MQGHRKQHKNAMHLNRLLLQILQLYEYIGIPRMSFWYWTLTSIFSTLPSTTPALGNHRVMGIFGVFSRMINNMPPQGVLKALALECKMLEDDCERNRSGLPEDAVSILCFYEFTSMVKMNNVMRCSTHLPPDHIEFYKATIARLIEAEELPPSAMNDFDYSFSL